MANETGAAETRYVLKPVGVAYVGLDGPMVVATDTAPSKKPDC